MGFNRQQRILLQRKTESFKEARGAQSNQFIPEGTAVFQKTDKGMIQKVRDGDQIFESLLTPELKENKLHNQDVVSDLTVDSNTTLLGSGGYSKLDNHLMLQWGKNTGVSVVDTYVTVIFAIPFERECFIAVANSMVETNVAASNYNIAVQAYGFEKYGFKAWVRGGAGTNYGEASHAGICWMALGV